MNTFVKNQTLPIQSTLFKTNKLNCSLSESISKNRVKNEKVKYVNYVASCGGDLWYVEYVTGPLKGQIAVFNAQELSTIRTKTNHKTLTVKGTYYDVSKKRNIKLNKNIVDQINIKSNSLVYIKKKLSQFKRFSYMYNFISSSGFSQKELTELYQFLNEQYHRDVRHCSYF